MASGSPFATFLIIGPVCFFLGMLFAYFPYDYYVLWAAPEADTPVPLLPTLPDPMPADALAARKEPFIALLEHHLRFLHHAPPVVSRILHGVIAVGVLGLMTKLYKPTEANLLFDGASVVLYMCGVAVYVTNMIKGMRVVTAKTYGIPGQDMLKSRFEAENMETAAQAAAGALPPEEQPLGREDTLKVIAASNTILALVLAGILILQAGQWYAEKKEAAELREIEAKEAAAAAGAGGAVAKKKGSASKSRAAQAQSGTAEKKEQ